MHRGYLDSVLAVGAFIDNHNQAKAKEIERDVVSELKCESMATV